MTRTDMPPSEARILYLRSGGICAFPGCNKQLIEPGTATDDPAFIGEIAHIVADSRQGPRGASPLNASIRLGIRGLSGGSSLAKLLKKHGRIAAAVAAGSVRPACNSTARFAK